MHKPIELPFEVVSGVSLSIGVLDWDPHLPKGREVGGFSNSFI